MLPMRAMLCTGNAGDVVDVDNAACWDAGADSQRLVFERKPKGASLKHCSLTMRKRVTVQPVRLSS